MNPGTQVVSELGSHRLRGMYFDYRGYCALRRVRTVEELRAFLDARGFKRVAATADVAKVVEGLRREAGGESCAALLLMEPILWLGVAFGMGGK
ncbi:MAG: hypothetical protein AAF961_00115 [Planctomycetota bacterium]